MFRIVKFAMHSAASQTEANYRPDNQCDAVIHLLGLVVAVLVAGPASLPVFGLCHPPKKVSFVCHASYQYLESISIVMQS